MNFLNTLWKSFLAIFVLIGAIGCNGDDKGLLGGGGATEPPETRDVTIVKLMVSPKDNAIPVGVLLPLNANLLLSDGSIVDVTSSDNIIWSSSDESITKVNPDATVEGMIVGEHTRGNDLEVNVIKGKKLTNMRASGTDEAVVLTPPIRVTLEYALEFINDDELVEVTPESIRIRKKFLLEHERKKASRAKVSEA